MRERLAANLETAENLVRRTRELRHNARNARFLAMLLREIARRARLPR